jgi:hypothetical protein
MYKNTHKVAKNAWIYHPHQGREAHWSYTLFTFAGLYSLSTASLGTTKTSPSIL